MWHFALIFFLLVAVKNCKGRNGITGHAQKPTLVHMAALDLSRCLTSLPPWQRCPRAQILLLVFWHIFAAQIFLPLKFEEKTPADFKNSMTRPWGEAKLNKQHLFLEWLHWICLTGDFSSLNFTISGWGCILSLHAFYKAQEPTSQGQCNCLHKKLHQWLASPPGREDLSPSLSKTSRACSLPGAVDQSFQIRIRHLNKYGHTQQEQPVSMDSTTFAVLQWIMGCEALLQRVQSHLQNFPFPFPD